MREQLLAVKHPIHRGFGRDILAFVGQLRHDLAWGVVPESFAREHVQHALTLLDRQGIRWSRLGPRASIVAFAAPTQCALVEPKLLARGALSCACANRFFNQLEDSCARELALLVHVPPRVRVADEVLDTGIDVMI